MKRLIFFLFAALPLCALYNGNPAEPAIPEIGVWISEDDWWGLKLGYEWDDVFHKRGKVKERKSSVRDRFDTFEMIKNQGVFTFNVSDRFELYGKLGVIKTKLSQRPINTVRMQYFTDNQLLWSFGGRIILVYWEEMVMGVNALYSGSYMSISEILENGVLRKASGARFKYNEWQLGVGFSREIGIFVPYIGLAYASMYSRLYNVPNDSNEMFYVDNEDLENREPFIFFLGLGLNKGKAVNVNLETRMVGEKSISLSGTFRF